MITFACPGCGKTFMVPDEYAGRSAKCKQCGGAVTVPSPRRRDVSVIPVDTARMTAAPLGGMDDPAIAMGPAPVATAPAVEHAAAPENAGGGMGAAPVGKKLPMRLRRLHADAEDMARAFAGSPLIRVLDTTGNPPELYRIEYQVNGLEAGPGGKPKPRDRHVVSIQLTSEYPRSAPACKMLTPVFHPNIDPASICVGDHWTAGERLSDLVVRIGEMIAYQAYNIRSPLDAEAAMWADLHQSELPVDCRDLHPTSE